ncbi:MAG TPA: SDR family NAD(P)-dependent oxidoreductase [Bryobacteraceae bacterium]|jgi:NAD(P)-dependent dehydrogenase (short-subunit alcohol dehydrogenase family)
MAFNFAGKHAIVTGGANGIGFAVARLLADRGARVSIFDLAAERPSGAAQRLGGRGYEVDVTDKTQLAKAFDDAGEPDVVVIAAGIAKSAPLFETTEEIWNRTIAVNLTGAFHTLQTAGDRMKSRGGAIVLIASTNSYDGEPQLAAYNASKAGLLGLLHTAANEWGPYGIRVNAVCPGLIRTRLNTQTFGDPKTLERYLEDIPLGRGGEPEEVANSVSFLASDDASYITGATLLVDGGQMASKFGTWREEHGAFDGQKWNKRQR